MPTLFPVLGGSAIIGNILESKGTVSAETIGPKGVTGIKVAALALFCVMIFAFVPLPVRFFISMQIKIGNGEFFLNEPPCSKLQGIRGIKHNL